MFLNGAPKNAPIMGAFFCWCKDRTFYDAGVKTYKCKVCEKTYTEPINALGHDAVLTYDGPVIDRWHCKRCGANWETGWNAIG